MADFTFSPLTPTAFLARSEHVYADRVAVVDGAVRLTYAELAHRCRSLTGALAELGVQPGDRVAVLCANSAVMLELHHGVPMRGAVLVALNVWLSVDERRWIMEHSGAQLLLATEEFAERAQDVVTGTGVRLLVATGADSEYEAALAGAEPDMVPCEDERQLLAINYTSGTTGRPKGAMYHHRGAYLQALAMAFHTRLEPASRSSGPCRCSIATGGASPGPSLPPAAPRSASGRSTRPRSGGWCGRRASPISAPRPQSWP
jgi:fatty-acyl-CoA synthase